MKIGNQAYYLIIVLALVAGTALQAQEQPFKVERATFSNRSFNEYTPVILNGNIVFRSDKPLNVRTKNADEDGNTSMNIFITLDQGEGNWSEPQLFANELENNRRPVGSIN